jgi:hypothetical protein
VPNTALSEQADKLAGVASLFRIGAPACTRYSGSTALM